MYLLSWALNLDLNTDAWWQACRVKPPFPWFTENPSKRRWWGPTEQMLFHFLLLLCSALFFMAQHICPKKEKCRCWLRHCSGYRLRQSGLGQDFLFCRKITRQRERGWQIAQRSWTSIRKVITGSQFIYQSIWLINNSAELCSVKKKFQDVWLKLPE